MTLFYKSSFITFFQVISDNSARTLTFVCHFHAKFLNKKAIL